MKYAIGIMTVLAVIAGIWYVSSDSAVAPTPSPSPEVSGAVSVTPTPSSAAAVSATPAATKTPIAAPAAGGYTSVQVAAHNTQSDCWSIINGSVYNLTSYVPKHPGGAQRMLMICGKDGSSLFEGQHGGQSKPENMLATLKIGTLAQ